MGFGIWLGVIAGLLLPVEMVHPRTWKATLMRDMGKEKDASRVKAMQMYPLAAKNLSLKKHHGRADALLIATYGERSHSEWNKGNNHERADENLFPF
jgi:hypothetical protein